jgi:ribose transport system ATP-binding protein
MSRNGDPVGESATESRVVLELRGISRQFGAVRALTDVSLDCRAGEVHAVVGENGSGKSTLLGIASGFVQPDRGTVRIGGKPLRRDSPAEARKLGLAMAYQDTSLIQAQPVKNNLYLAAPPGRRPPFWRRKKWARRVLAEFDLDLELFPDAPAGALTLADRQLFEVAKALATDPLVLLLDEPTTALGPDEVQALHRTVAGCRDRGVGVVYVSHRLPEVLEVADRVTVLRDGRSQGTFEASSTTEAELVELIVGRPFEAAFPPPAPVAGEPREVLIVDGLQGQAFGPISLTLGSGEIVGIAGAEGNGQPQLFDCLAGRQPPKAGRVVCAGKDLMLISTHEAVRAGIMLLPGDRKHEALMPVLGVRVNATVQSLRRFSALGFLRRRAERRAVEDLVNRLEIRTPSLEQPVEFLSGGNQQKVSVSRTFLKEPSVILAYEPTQGVDVGSRFDIYKALRSRADAGTALLVKSSDPLELAGLCDRVLVMSRGQIIEEIPGDELDELRIVEAMVRGPGLSRARRSPLGVAMPKASSANGTR